ncbi:MAG: ribulose-phosphate 3-epimerase [Chloroflexota bacterium]|nr:ribulose-phosphate 3-epimerase [Chloroflexota bacterium]
MTSSRLDVSPRPVRIAPSVLAADFGHLADNVKAAHSAGAHSLHFDVMDARFVPNLSFGPAVIQSVRHASSRLFDVHLMVTEPMRHLELFLGSAGDLFTLHVEACADVPSALQAFRNAKKRVGLAIKPDTPVEALLPYLPDLDLALVMTVEPGWGGQAFMPAMLEKVRVLRRVIDREGLDVRLQVDGGINAETAVASVLAGADVLVAGSSIFAPGQTVADNMDHLTAALHQADISLAPVG